MRYLPPTDHGYAIHVPSGTVHQRHADHGRDLVRTSMIGVYNYLGDRSPVLCEECFDVPKARSHKVKATKPKVPEPVEEPAPVTVDDLETLAAVPSEGSDSWGE
jgi:hypothetical protein